MTQAPKRRAKDDKPQSESAAGYTRLTRQHFADWLEMFKHIVRYGDDRVDEDELVSLPVWQLRQFITELEYSRRPGRGGAPRTANMRVGDALVAWRAKRRKQELIDNEHMKAVAAEAQAANEVAKTDKRRRGLSASVILDRLQHPARYRSQTRD